MKIIYNRLLPPLGFKAMMLFGVIVARKRSKPLSPYVINHESIHRAQAKECGGYLFFYLRYLAQSIRWGYRHAPFEVEAYMNDEDMHYIKNREPFAWRDYL